MLARMETVLAVVDVMGYPSTCVVRMPVIASLITVSTRHWLTNAVSHCHPASTPSMGPPLARIAPDGIDPPVGIHSVMPSVPHSINRIGPTPVYEPNDAPDKFVSVSLKQNWTRVVLVEQELKTSSCWITVPLMFECRLTTHPNKGYHDWLVIPLLHCRSRIQSDWSGGILSSLLPSAPVSYTRTLHNTTDEEHSNRKEL